MRPSTMPGPVMFGLSLIVGVILATLGGLIIGVPCLRLRGDYLAIATLGFAEIIRILLNNFNWVEASRGLDIPYQIIVRSPETMTSFYTFHLIFTWSMVLVTFIVIRNLIPFSHGRAIISLREDEVASQLIGVNITQIQGPGVLGGRRVRGTGGGDSRELHGTDRTARFHHHWRHHDSADGRARRYGLDDGNGPGDVHLVFGAAAVQARALEHPDEACRADGHPVPQDFAAGVEALARERWQICFAVLLMILMISIPQGLFGKKEIWETKLWRRLFGSGKKSNLAGATGGEA
jgi:ABC-type branched-subunit amino acid transport system permease subunit